MFGTSINRQTRPIVSTIRAGVMTLCRGKIANYKLPKEVRFISEADLPRSSTGKIKRHELKVQ